MEIKGLMFSAFVTNNGVWLGHYSAASVTSLRISKRYGPTKDPMPIEINERRLNFFWPP